MPGVGTLVMGGTNMDRGKKSSAVGIMMASFAAFGGILFGFDTGVISGVKEMNAWLKTFGYETSPGSGQYTISTQTEALVVSILSAGTFVGALLGAPMADLLGRKNGILLACIVFAAGIILQASVVSVDLFIVGRLVAGLGVGMVSCLVPMYQAESSPKWIRGAVVAGYQWAIVTKDRTDMSAFRIPILIQLAWTFVLFVGMYFLPESPRYLVKRRRDLDAMYSLARLFNVSEQHPDVRFELEEIKTSLQLEEEQGGGTYADCFRMSNNKALLRTLSGIGIQAFQQLTGINFIFYYGTTFFKNSGIADPFLIAVVTNCVNVGMTIPAFWAIDNVGRRRLLIIGALGMMVCEYLIGIIGVIISVDNHTGQSVLVALTCVYIAFFACTWGPVPWVVPSEIFPLAIRAKGVSLSTASNWALNFGIGYAVPYMVNKGYGDLGPRVFFIWGSTCLGCAVFTYFCIMETKGLSLEQIDALYHYVNPIHSLSYHDQLIAHTIRSADDEALSRGDPVSATSANTARDRRYRLGPFGGDSELHYIGSKEWHRRSDQTQASRWKL
ncbi:probable monosaccharide transporter [Serendipita indica DSM 11827]|uniref:Probable monosaccharide transporter n=1 Tax=Serendipita indica (strain DSM 11827) TaxID=1109443 RepID=G4TGR1_SERID|nr:probable monosaccharide transporter [Serendipita indica DSM 11827]